MISVVFGSGTWDCLVFQKVGAMTDVESRKELGFGISMVFSSDCVWNCRAERGEAGDRLQVHH